MSPDTALEVEAARLRARIAQLEHDCAMREGVIFDRDKAIAQLKSKLAKATELLGVVSTVLIHDSETLPEEHPVVAPIREFLREAIAEAKRQ